MELFSVLDVFVEFLLEVGSQSSYFIFLEKYSLILRFDIIVNVRMPNNYYENMKLLLKILKLLFQNARLHEVRSNIKIIGHS